MVRSSAALLWALAALSAGYWGLRLSGARADLAGAPAVARAPGAADPSAIARLMGAAGAPAPGVVAAPSIASRLSLAGVVAGNSGSGSALIAVDGKPPRPFAVGARVDEGLVLQSVQGRRALLGPAPGVPATVTLDMPPLPR